MEKKTCNKPLCDLNHGSNVTYRWYILVFYVVFPWKRRDSTNMIYIDDIYKYSFHEINFTKVGPSQENILSGSLEVYRCLGVIIVINIIIIIHLLISK